MMAADLPPIPPPLVDRFEKAFAKFVEAVSNAVDDAATKPELAATPSFRSWQSKALPLLQQQNVSLQAALALFQKGDLNPILTFAEDKRALAKDMDGFSLTFSGPDHAADLEALQTAVVMAAFNLCAAAGIP